MAGTGRIWNTAFKTFNENANKVKGDLSQKIEDIILNLETRLNGIIPITDSAYGALYKNTVVVISTDRSIALADGSCTVYVTTGASDRTITILSECLVSGFSIKIVKVDSGAGKVIIATEGAEVIYNQYVSFTTIEIWQQFARIELETDGTQWIKTNSPYLHLLDESERNSSSDLNVNPGTSYAECDLSASVPAGTLAIYGCLSVITNDEISVLRIRDGSSSETDGVRLKTIQIGDVGTTGIYKAEPTLIKATNGIFDYADVASYTIGTLQFLLWGWLL